MQFCRQMLQEQGREMTMLEVAQWMVAEGISTVDGIRPQSTCGYNNPSPAAVPSAKTNPAIKIDLRRYLRADHPELQRRAIAAHLPLSGMWLSASTDAGKGQLPSQRSAGVPDPWCTRKWQATSTGYSQPHRPGAEPGTRRAGWKILELSVPQRAGNLQPGSAPAG